MKKGLSAIVLTMALVTSLMAGRGSGKAADSAIPAVAETAKTEGGESSKDAGNSLDAAAGKADTTADKTDLPRGAGALIGIVMPTKDLRRWNQDGANMKAELETADYEVDLQYTSNDAQIQVSQIENMISNGCQMLIIASIDGSFLGESSGQAKKAGILVIPYNRLIMNSGAATYYATFDSYKVGQKQGEYLVEALGFEITTESKNTELFAGDPTDNNCNFLFSGATDMSQKYIDEGRLVTKPGQTVPERVATANWDSEKAQNHMDITTAGNHSDGAVLDAVLCFNDSTILGVEGALASSYTGTYPVIIGQDYDIANVKNMLNGKQAISVLKDTRTLATQVVKVVGTVMQGGEAGINDPSSCDNGTGVIPAYLCEPMVVTADNYKEMLMDSGYYTEDQIKQISIQERIPLSVKRRRKTNSRDG